jgi:hypothetical protein
LAVKDRVARCHLQFYQRFTVSKDLRSQGCSAGRDGEAFQTATVQESLITNGGYAIRYDYAS